MTIQQPRVLLDEITDFLARSPDAQEIIAFKPSEALQARALALLEKNREDRLSDEERDELEAFMHMENFMTLLKAKARLRLTDQE
jgi:hypothetical protein